MLWEGFMKPETRKELQKQIDNVKLHHPCFEVDSRFLKANTCDYYMELYETLDWVLRHAFFDMIIDEQVNYEKYMILYIDFKKAIKILKHISYFSTSDEELCHIIECERFFMEHDSFAINIKRKYVSKYLKKRIVFQNYKVNISDKELFDKWIHEALGSAL